MINKGLRLAAAGVLACSAAAAAEATSPSPRPPALCGATGGALLLPGSGICVRLGGAVRAEVAARATAALPSLVTGHVATLPAGARAFRRQAQGRVDLDARTETGMGPFRAFLSVKTP